MLRKHQAIQDTLEQLDRTDLTAYERNQYETELRREVTSIWHSDELRRKKPTPVDEARTGLAIVENVIWDAVPIFMRKLDDVVRHELGHSLPLDAAPIKFASWMGGDRDGNPNVTPAITLEVSMMSRWTAANLLKGDIKKLRAQLSLTTASAELIAATNGMKEPYREVLRKLEGRIDVTLDWLNANILGVPRKTLDTPVMTTAELRDPLMMLHRSLVETKNEDIGDGLLIDIIRRLSCFGLSLLPLDIRQESTRHTEALDAITRFLGVGSYAQWDESTRRNWLQTELASKRPLLPRLRDLSSFGFSLTVVDTLKTFELAASLGSESLGAYVISQCQQASDVLAVTLLQQDAGMSTLMRVVPLFETLDDLERAPDTVQALFAMPVYRGRIGRHQEIMVGYSDSAKDAGRIAASWAQYKAQEAMVAVANRYAVELTFFHGKGGTVGRGGNPAIFKAILAHPPDTIKGRFRITEQGEMITQNLGRRAIAERTFDLFTAGVLVDQFKPRPEPKQEWRDMMEQLSHTSCQIYRKVVREEPRFVPYFRTATPELELSGLNVGSRPAKRNPKGGVESLRAIPWVFAWTQTRLNLPTWLGVGEAIKEASKTDLSLLREMYKDWLWFQTLIDLLEMILVKSEIRIAENYDNQLVTDPESQALGQELRDRFRATIEAVLSVSGNPALQSSNPILLQSLYVRNPYVDPLNVIQAELLKRLRSETSITDSEKEVLMNSLLITINGVANGMRNSG
jgi:phosphoenolpyruvate carboxylase